MLIYLIKSKLKKRFYCVNTALTCFLKKQCINELFYIRFKKCSFEILYIGVDTKDMFMITVSVYVLIVKSCMILKVT